MGATWFVWLRFSGDDTYRFGPRVVPVFLGTFWLWISLVSRGVLCGLGVRGWVYGWGVVDPVGSMDIARRLGVKEGTVVQWSQRKLLPPARWRVSGRPCWEWTDVERWARATGRLSGQKDGDHEL